MADEVQFWLEDHALAVFVVLGAALAVVAVLAFRGPAGSAASGDAVDLSEEQILSHDAAATDALREAQAALTRVNRVFTLDDGYLPRPSLFQWTGSQPLAADRDWYELKISNR